MHFVFEAKPDGADWIAAWSGALPHCGIGAAVAIAQSRIRSCLAWRIHDAIAALLSGTPGAGTSFTFEIRYV